MSKAEKARCYAYDFNAIDSRLKELLTYASNHNLNIHTTYTDTTAERPVFDDLAGEILQGGDTLLITQISDLGADNKAIATRLSMLWEKNIVLIVTDISEQAEAVEGERVILNTMLHIYQTQLSADEEKKRGGRPRAVQMEEFTKVYAEVESKKITAVQAMQKLGMKKTTYYNYKKEYERTKKTVKNS